MLYAIQVSGPTGWMMVLLAVVIALLVVRKVVPLMKGTFEPGPAWESGLNAILFWGAFAAVLGFLGQCFGIYNAMRAIQQADVMSPAVQEWNRRTKRAIDPQNIFGSGNQGVTD